jgi:hypothetical protein
MMINGIPKLALMPQDQAKQGMGTFVQNLKSHFADEEQIMFPLTLKANSLQLTNLVLVTERDDLHSNSGTLLI